MLRHGHRQPWLIESGATGRSMRARKHRAVIPSDSSVSRRTSYARDQDLRSRPERGDSESGRQVIAYLSLSRIWGLPSGAGVRALAEYGGSRAALLDSLPSVLDAAGLTELRVSFPTHDIEMIHLLRSRSVSLSPDTIHSHTFRLLDLPGLLRALRPYFAARLPAAALRAFSVEATGERVSPAGERVNMQFGSERADLSLSETAAIMLGGPAAPAIDGELGEIARRIFPVPLPLPGLNYV
jgi:hypothetical protein